MYLKQPKYFLTNRFTSLATPAERKRKIPTSHLFAGYNRRRSRPLRRCTCMHYWGRICSYGLLFNYGVPHA